MADRRKWAGYFRVCPGCAKRNWIGRKNCTACGVSLLAVAPQGAEPPGRWRRGGERVGSRRLAWPLIIAAVLATGSAILLRQVLRADPGGFEVPPVTVTDAVEPRPLVEFPPEVPAPSPTAASTLEDRAAFDRGRRLLEAGAVRASLGPLTRAAEAFPEDALVIYTYGTALWRAGWQDRALFQLEKAVLLAPGAASYHVTLALALVRAGRRERAMQEYQTAYQLDPTNAAAAEALATSGFRTAAEPTGFREPAGGAPGAGATVDMGGSSRRTVAPSAAPGRVFTNEDLQTYRPGSPAGTMPARD
jgi:tetratricopeptide (TPR) repeat protein